MHTFVLVGIFNQLFVEDGAGAAEKEDRERPGSVNSAPSVSGSVSGATTSHQDWVSHLPVDLFSITFDWFVYGKCNIGLL